MVRLIVSMGCPSGIGPEVIVRAAEKLRGARVLVVGDITVLQRAITQTGSKLRAVFLSPKGDVPDGAIGIHQPSLEIEARDCRLGHPSKNGGAAQLLWINTACDIVANGDGDALVTGPVSKEWIVKSGARSFHGHTEHLAERLKAKDPTMAFATPRYTAALVTTHLPLRAVPKAITAERVSRAIVHLAEHVRGGRKRPIIGVAALNPHSGEGGIFGNEETTITRGIALARKRVRGVIIEDVAPAEVLYRRAERGEIAGVVAMYHDQATIPVKTDHFEDAVNITLGLPIIRTSPDHGTAYDRARRCDSDPRPMLAAMMLAVTLAS